MPLTLVLGPANSAKAGEVLGAFAAHRSALLVVPTADDAAHYTRELAGDGAVLGSVLTFPGLAAEIARRAGYGARRLTKLQRERVLQRAVQRAGLDSLSALSQRPGFLAAAGELIAELERALIAPGRFEHAMRAWAAADRRRAGYAQEVAAIYLAYDRELARIEAVDAELYAWRALDALRAAPGRWGSDPVFFYGFDDLHALQRDAVETLASVANAEVTLSLTYEPGRPALSARAEVVEELRPLARQVLELPAVETYYAPESRAGLHHLERSLFDSAATRVDPGPAVRLLEAGGERAEAELVAAEVLALIRDGVPAEEIAVVYRSVPGALVERVFARYGIAVAGERELPFAHTAIGRGLLGLARCAWLDERHAEPQDLLAYLRTPGLLRRTEVIDRLEATIRREGVRALAQARTKLDFELGEIDALKAAPDPAAELARHARRLLAAAHRGEAAVLEPEEELDARAVATMLRALSEVAELGEALSGPELIELLGTLEISAGHPAAPGAVLLSEPLAIRARRFRAVFICGLQENEFPRQAAPEPFLPDEYRRELAQASGLRLRADDGALARERYLFYATVARATDQVVLSYRSSDEEGNLALPSPFIADACELLVPEWPDRRRRRLLADVVWEPDEAPTLHEHARSNAAAGPSTHEVSPAAAGLSEVALAHVRHREMLSGGALESYADCPVRWLVERELQVDDLDPPPDGIARGSYMHAALEHVVERLGRGVTPESLPEAIAILDDVLDGLSIEIGPGRSAGVRRAMLRSIEADLRRYLEHEAHDGCDWEPRAIELRFGFEDEEGVLPPLGLGEGGKRIRLRGVIDRIDVAADGRRAIVRDYKSAGARPEYAAARWSADRRLQVALYMLAARELLGLEPVAGLYQPLGGGDLRPRGMFLEGSDTGAGLVANDARDQRELEDELEDAAARAIALAIRLRAGELTPCPETCARDGCRYPGICRSS